MISFTKKLKRRQSLLTFLSKSYINKIIQAIGEFVQAAGMFSLQVDTTHFMQRSILNYCTISDDLICSYIKYVTIVYMKDFSLL